jgi:hypothetical protein
MAAVLRGRATRRPQFCGASGVHSRIVRSGAHGGHYLPGHRFADRTRRCSIWSVSFFISFINQPRSIAMNTVNPSNLLRRTLIVDAAASAATGLLQTLAAGTLAAWLGLPLELLIGTGLFLLAYATMLVVMARSTRLPRALITLVLVGNLGWAAGCIALAVAWSGTLTGLGIAYLELQALAVVAFAAGQWLGLRQSQAAFPLATQSA